MSDARKVRTQDEERAEVLLRPLRGEPNLAPDLVDFAVTRVAVGMLVARLEGLVSPRSARSMAARRTSDA